MANDVHSLRLSSLISRLSLLPALALLIGCEATPPVGVRAIDTVLVTPASVTLVMGQSASLAASLRDEFGVAFSGVPIRWRSGDEAVAVVSPVGVVTALGVGSTSVFAIADADSGSSSVTVTGFPMIELTPSTVSFAATVGGSDPPDQAVTISNSGDGTLVDVLLGGITYGVGQQGGWLTLQLVEGPLTIVVRASIVGLAAGSYDAEVSVEGGGASNTPVILPVSLVVAP